MGFFSEIQPTAEFVEPEPRRVKWQGTSDDTVGAFVPIGPFQVQNEEVAIVATGFFAYPTGFTFTLVTLSRLTPPPAPLSFHHPARRDNDIPPGASCVSESGLLMGPSSFN